MGGHKISETTVLNSTAKQDETIAANAAQSKANYTSGKQQYNLYTNNSTDAVVNVLNTNTGYKVQGNTLIPNIDFGSIKESVRVNNMAPEQRQAYFKERTFTPVPPIQVGFSF